MSKQDTTRGPVAEDGLIEALQRANSSRLPFYDDEHAGRDWRTRHDPVAAPAPAPRAAPAPRKREPRQPTAAQQRDRDELLRVIAGDFAPQVKRGVSFCNENKLAGSAATAAIIGLSVLALRQMG